MDLSILQNDFEVAQELYNVIKQDTLGIEKCIKDDTLELMGGDKLLVKETFEDMNLNSKLLQAIYSAGYKNPSRIQQIVVPHILIGKDLAVQSKSGTGKTIAFAIGMLTKIVKGEGVQAIILSPTRELNTQIHSEITKLTRHLGLECFLSLFDKRAENINHEVVLGSPASVLSLINRGRISPNNMKMLILDEADVLLDKVTMGPQSFRLLKILEKSQKVYISATYNEGVKSIIGAYSPNSATVYEKDNSKPEEIKLYYVDVDNNEKVDALQSLYGLLTIAQVIVFVSRKSTIKKLQSILVGDMNSVSVLHGDLSSQERDRAVEDFRTSKTKILITTDVFSRGMDIPQVNLIINFDMPYRDNKIIVETYIHRIGRSGRFGRSGFVIDMISGERDLAGYVQIQESLGTISKKFTVKALMDVNASDI